MTKKALDMKNDLMVQFEKGKSNKAIAQYMGEQGYFTRRGDMVELIRNLMGIMGDDEVEEKPVEKPVKFSKVTNSKQAADVIDEAADRWMAMGKKHFSHDKHMMDAYRKDSADLKSIASILRSGKVTIAFGDACNLDTIVRECIPNSAWEWMKEKSQESLDKKYQKIT